MKRTVLMRALLGAPLGIALNLMISIFISICVGGGRFYAVVPAFAEACGNELTAVCVQTALCAVYGAVFGGASVVWRLESWSLLKQTVVHFAICSAATLPVAYTARWMQQTAGGVLRYFCIFIAIYTGIWAAQYLRIRQAVRGMNSRLSDQADGECGR